MLIADAINTVHLLSQGNTDYPTSGDDDFQLYLGFINDAIKIWQHQEGVIWNELMDTLTGSLTSGDATYNCDADYALPAGQFFVGTTHYQYSTAQEHALTNHVDSSYPHFTVTGPLGTKVITLYPTPGTDLNGATFTHPFIREATTYTTGEETTPIDMADPYYAIHYAVGMVMLEDNPQVASTNISLANQKLTAMRIANDIKPQGSIEVHNDTTYSGFGV